MEQCLGRPIIVPFYTSSIRGEVDAYLLTFHESLLFAGLLYFLHRLFCMFVSMDINWNDIFLYGGLVFFIGGIGGIAYWYLLEETIFQALKKFKNWEKNENPQ